MLTFQRVGAAHTRLLALCVCPPGAEPWATRTFVITRPLLEADSISRFLSALQGCCEACWHGFLKFSTGPCNYISLDVGAVVDRGVLVDPASTRLTAKCIHQQVQWYVLCVFLDFEQPALYFLPYLPWWPHLYNHSWIKPHWLTSARGSRGPEQYFWSGMNTQEQEGARCPIWCGKKQLLEHFCSFCLEKEIKVLPNLLCWLSLAIHMVWSSHSQVPVQYTASPFVPMTIVVMQLRQCVPWQVASQTVSAAFQNQSSQNRQAALKENPAKTPLTEANTLNTSTGGRKISECFCCTWYELLISYIRRKNNDGLTSLVWSKSKNSKL